MTIKKKRTRKIKTPGVYLDTNDTYYLKYKNKTYRGFKTVEEAEIKKAQLMLTPDNASSVKMSVIIADYLESEKIKYETNKITYGTYDKKKSLCRLHITPTIGDISLKKLTPLKLRDFRKHLISTDQSTENKNAILGVLKQVLKHTVLYFENDRDLSIHLESIPMSDIEKLKRKVRFSNIWNDDEFDLFIKHVKRNDLIILFTLFFKHGLRLGEATALRWTELDADNYTLLLDGSITKKTPKKHKERKSTKTKSSERIIYIGKTRVEQLLTLRESQEKLYGFTESWYIFGDKLPLAESTIRNARNRACDDAKLKRVWNHDMRHMFVTNSWSKVPLPALSAYIGHKNVGVTLERYSHLSKEDEKGMRDFMDKMK